MATIKQTLDELMTLDGAMCAAVVDSASGMMLSVDFHAILTPAFHPILTPPVGV